MLTDDSRPGGHPLVVLFQGQVRLSRFSLLLPDRLGIDRRPFGRLSNSDELEIVPAPA